MREGDSQKEEVFPDPYNLIIIVNYVSCLIPMPQAKHSMK